VDKQNDVRALAAFFVAEVFLAGEKPWKADLEKIKNEAKRAF